MTKLTAPIAAGDLCCAEATKFSWQFEAVFLRPQFPLNTMMDPILENTARIAIATLRVLATRTYLTCEFVDLIHREIDELREEIGDADFVNQSPDRAAF